MKTTIVAILLAAIAAGSLRAGPMGTAFTYQGKLNDGGAPATGLYDFVFKLYTGPGPGDSQVASAVPLTAVLVTNGLFTVKLDFGANVFQGDARWLDTEVRTNDNLASYSELSPRQELTPQPHAIYAGSTPWSGVSGGWGNVNQTTYGTIGGGANHLLQAPYSATIAGGYQNTVYGQDATLGGGSYNTGQADYSIIAGGQFNYVGTNIHDLGEFGLITNYASYSALLGGEGNRISSIYSSVGGGANNLVYGDYSQIGGGSGKPGRRSLNLFFRLWL